MNYWQDVYKRQAFDKEEWKESQKKALNKLSRKVKIDGFRQGKAPIAVVKARIGKGKILEEATDMILQANFAKALEEAKVEPIAQPALSVDKIDEEELQVKILVPVSYTHLIQICKLIVYNVIGDVDEENSSNVR